MFSGIQEILLLLVILAAILFVPRIIAQFRPSSHKRPLKIRKQLHLNVRLRIALLASLIWPLGAAIHFRPWKGPMEPFLIYGIGPIVLGWGIGWVLAGFAASKKN